MKEVFIRDHQMRIFGKFRLTIPSHSPKAEIANNSRLISIYIVERQPSLMILNNHFEHRGNALDMICQSYIHCKDHLALVMDVNRRTQSGDLLIPDKQTVELTISA